MKKKIKKFIAIITLSSIFLNLAMTNYNDEQISTYIDNPYNQETMN